MTYDREAHWAAWRGDYDDEPPEWDAPALWRALHAVLDELERQGENPDAVAPLLALCGHPWPSGAAARAHLRAGGWRQPRVPAEVVAAAEVPSDLAAWWAARLTEGFAGRNNVRITAEPAWRAQRAPTWRQRLAAWWRGDR